jgi:hypothetical protein
MTNILEVPTQVKLDSWVAEYAQLMITACHFDLQTAIDMGLATLIDIDHDIETTTPSEAVSDDIDAMRSSC